jgi:hypothetical protein
LIDPKLQPLKVSVEFSYDAELFEGDPDDAYEIASLEQEALEDALQGAIDSILGDYKGFRVNISPA